MKEVASRAISPTDQNGKLTLAAVRLDPKSITGRTSTPKDTCSELDRRNRLG
jgi:hypothetical protein